MISTPLIKNKEINEVHNNNIFKGTILEDWELTSKGIRTEDGFLLNPSSLQLLQWKFAYYDRGKRMKFKW